MIDQREHQQLDHDRRGEDREPKVEHHAPASEYLRQRVQQPSEERTREEPEISPVYGVVKARNRQRALVVAQQFIALGAGEHALRIRDRAARWDIAPLAAIGGAIIVCRAFVARVVVGRNALALIGDNRGQPVVIGDPKPTALPLQILDPLIGADTPALAVACVLVGVAEAGEMKIVVGAERANQTLVDDAVEFVVFGHALSPHGAERTRRDGRGALVPHGVRDGEHVVGVDGDGAFHHEPVLAAQRQRDRRLDSEARVCVRRPLTERVRKRGGAFAILDFPAEKGVVSVGRRDRRKQIDLWTCRIDRAPIPAQTEVVEARAFQRN